MCEEAEEKSQPPIPWRDADYLPGLSQQGCLGIQQGGSSCLTQDKSQPRPRCGTLSDLAASDTLLLLLPWIQPGWSKSQTSGEAAPGGVYQAGLGVLRSTRGAAHSLGVPS